MSTKITLDQWQALIAVVDEGGYAAAAEALNKSQSAISYAIQKIETELGVRAFALEGRRARLTETGHLLYRQAKVLLEEAGRIESVRMPSAAKVSDSIGRPASSPQKLRWVSETAQRAMIRSRKFRNDPSSVS